MSASQIVEVLKDIIAEEHGEGEPVEGDDDESLAWVNARSVGKILSKLRFKKERDLSRTRGKFRLITPLEIVQLAIAHHLIHLSTQTSGEDLSEETSGTSANVQTSARCPTCGEQDWGEWHEGRRICMSCLRQGS